MSDEQPKLPAAPAVAKYDPTFARMEIERTKLRQAVMAKFFPQYDRFVYGNEAAAARINEEFYILPDFWSEDDLRRSIRS